MEKNVRLTPTLSQFSIFSHFFHNKIRMSGNEANFFLLSLPPGRQQALSDSLIVLKCENFRDLLKVERDRAKCHNPYELRVMVMMMMASI